MFVQRNATKRPPQTYDMIEHTSVSLCGSSSFPVGLTLFLEEGYKLRLMMTRDEARDLATRLTRFAAVEEGAPK